MKRGFVPFLALLAMAVSAASAQAVPHSKAQGLSHRNACGVPAAGSARCHAKVVTNDDGSTFAGPSDSTGLHSGWSPADLQNAYKLPAFNPATPPTVAIVDAFDDPNAELDLAQYRQDWGLAPCTTGNGCFKKVNQNGVQGSYPAADKGWAEEIALDLDMVSAACPSCHILLVEATSNSFANLMTAVDRAATTPGVVAVSNSYGASEFSGETTYDSHFNRPGIAITVSSGDAGYGAEYPAASRYVTATGGTSLSSASNARGFTETAWSGAGSGCSSYETKPAWQTSPLVPTTCGRRTIADVSSVSNPNTGVAVYNTYGGDPGWMVFGGTSAAAPFIAGVYAVGGSKSQTYAANWPYTNTAALFDVTSGSNGRCTTGRNKSSGGAYLCTSGPGYDGPTGLGTPNGAGAF
jgi:subtilase family serine protease